MKPFILDNEIVLNAANDLLKTSIYAENLVDVIENTPKDKVFTIGVFGGWGTGKSSIIKTAQDTIERTHKKVKFITYDAWKYANDSFRRMFLLKIQNELGLIPTEEMNRFYQSEVDEAEPKTKLSAKGIAIAVGVVLIISLILFFIPSVPEEWKVGVPTIGTLGTFLIALINGCFYDLKISYSKPSLFAPEQFEACFKEMMSKCLKRKNWFKRVFFAAKDYVEITRASLVGIEKLIIVIDNIDRCPSEMAYQLLTDVKTFLSNEDYNLVFIVPVDDDALKKHLFRKWDYSRDEDSNICREKEEFLRKFFNVTLRIKPHQGTELQHFANKLNRNIELGFNGDTLAIVAKEYADNPRRIIQLLNNLSCDLSLYEEDFAKKYETVICAALILREAYTSFYNQATKDLSVIFNYETRDDRAALNAFMRRAYIIFKQTPSDVMQRILTNTSSIFNDLPEDIQAAVCSYDVDKVKVFSENNQNLQSILVDFALDKLNTDVKYKAQSQVTQWLSFMSQLYKNRVCDNSRFSAINAALAPYYKTALPIVKDQNTLHSFGKCMADAGFGGLRRETISFLQVNIDKDNNCFESVLRGALSNYNSEKDCKDLAPIISGYFLEHPIYRDFDYSDIQIRSFFGDEFVGKLLEKLVSIDNDRGDDLLWCFNRNKNLSTTSFVSLFNKYSTLFGQTRGKSLAEYLSLIDCLNPYMGVVETSSMENEISQVYCLVTNPRGIPHPSYRAYPQHDSMRSILDEVNDEQAKSVIEFCFEVARISGGKVDISRSVEILFKKNKAAVVGGAIKIDLLGMSLGQIAGVLVNVDDYDSANDLHLLEILLSRQPDGSMMLDDRVVEKKLQTLVDNSINDNVEKLLQKLVKDTQICEIVTKYVASLNSEKVNVLPLSVARYAISTFNRENAESYKNNTDFLIRVLKQGSALQKKEVVRLMKAKINNEEDLDNVILVLNNLETEDQGVLKSLISELETIKDNETISEETRANVMALIERLSSFIKKTGIIVKLLGK